MPDISRLVGRPFARWRPKQAASFPRALPKWRAAAVDLLFPPRCAVCDAGGSLLCQDCRDRFTVAAPPRCPRCWSPSDGSPGSASPGIVCDRCRAKPPDLRSLRAAFVFEGAARAAVLVVKYQGLTATAAPIITRAATPGLSSDLDLVTAVPMSGRRRRRRGHNQAALFGALLASRCDLPFDEQVLRRHRATPQQARQPSLSARHANVRDAFRADPVRAAGRTILVVDDVTTSGATLNACAAALLQAGAAAVDGWAVARED